MTLIKGTNLVHARDFVEWTFGLEAWAAVVSRMTPESRANVTWVVAAAWYPARLHVELLQAIDAELDRCNGVQILHAGAYAAEFDFTRVHRALFRLPNPELLLDRIDDIWRRYYDSGTWSVVRTTQSSAQVSLANFGIIEGTYCAYLGAYLARLLELVGARDVTISHPICRARGGAVCRFDESWRPDRSIQRRA